MTRGRHRNRNPRTGTIILLAAIAIAMIAGTVAVACISRNQEAEPPTRNPTTAQAVPDPEQEQSQEAEPSQFRWPVDITWERVAGLDLPISASDGPRNRNLGLAKNYIRSPAGAVLAALHLIARTSYQVGPDIWEPTLRDQVVGPDAAAYVDEVRADHRAALQRGEPTDRIYATVVGIRLDVYQPEAASMRILIEAPTGTGTARASALVQVTWNQDDWRLVAPPRGDWSTVRIPVPVHAVADYTPLPAR